MNKQIPPSDRGEPNPAPDPPAPRRRARPLRLALAVCGLGIAVLVLLFLPPGRGARDAVQIHLQRVVPTAPNWSYAIFSVTNTGHTTVRFRASLIFVNLHEYSKSRYWRDFPGSAKLQQYSALGRGDSTTVYLPFYGDVAQLGTGLNTNVLGLTTRQGEVVWYEEPSSYRKTQFKVMGKIGSMIPALKPMLAPWASSRMYTNHSTALHR